MTVNLRRFISLDWIMGFELSAQLLANTVKKKGPSFQSADPTPWTEFLISSFSSYRWIKTLILSCIGCKVKVSIFTALLISILFRSRKIPANLPIYSSMARTKIFQKKSAIFHITKKKIPSIKSKISDLKTWLKKTNWLL